MTGWKPEEPSFALSSDEAQAYQQRYADLAAELRINICPGTTVSRAPVSSSSSARPALLNTSCFIDHRGNVLGSYTKTNLWIPERHHLTSSVDSFGQLGIGHPDPHQVFDTPLGPTGILVCWDLAFPEAFRALVRAGAKLVIVPSYWTLRDMSPEGLAYNTQCEKTFVNSALVTRAFESTAAIIYCNAGGPKEEGFFGCSQVAMPVVGRVEGSFDDGEEATRVLEVDMRLVDIAERNYQIRRDLGRQNWHYGYEKESKASQPVTGRPDTRRAQL